MKKAALAIIPARGGSKRIPYKNIKPFHGQPIITYSIRAALESGVFDNVMVSTDDEEIAKVALAHGASVPFLRSARTSDDFATTADVLLEVLNILDQRGESYESVCCLYPTAPFLTGAKISNSYASFRSTNAQSLMSIVKFGFPVQRALHFHDGVTTFWMPEHKATRSQDLEPMYHDAGQLYWFRSEHFLRTGQFITSDCQGFELSELEVQDIDNEVDWRLAELKYGLIRTMGDDLSVEPMER